MWKLIARFVTDDVGQDVVEYALLVAVFGFCGVAAWPLVVDAIGNAYTRTDATTQDLWEVPNPQ